MGEKSLHCFFVHMLIELISVWTLNKQYIYVCLWQREGFFFQDTTIIKRNSDFGFQMYKGYNNSKDQNSFVFMSIYDIAWFYLVLDIVLK